MAKKLETASVLAFERKLNNSDAIMSSGQWERRTDREEWKTIHVEQKDVRGTISNRLKNTIQSDPAKLDAEIQKANLQRVDIASLPFDADTLKVSFSLRILGDLSTPSACNDQDYQQKLSETINSYALENQFSELALRYATNLANGRFLWRNRIGAEAAEVRVKHIVDQKAEKVWTFNCLDYDLKSFNAPDEDLFQLASVISNGLMGETYSFLKVDAFVRLGEGQEVYPSQELVLDSSRDNQKSKTLYQVYGAAAMHSQKIGNALRTIDTWYPESVELGPIAVEPYGSVTNRGRAYRQPKEGLDFFSLLDAWILKDKIPSIEQQHYVMATLIRGGVFGKSAK